MGESLNPNQGPFRGASKLKPQPNISRTPMPLPDFTSDEQYLIDCVKSPKAWAGSNSYMWSYLTGGAVIAGFSAYYQNVLMMLAAFVVVCGLRIYEERLQSRWMPLWQSIIAKYEAAATVADDAAEAGSGQVE